MLTSLCPVKGAEDAQISNVLRRRVEHFVLKLTTGEFGSDEIPHQL